MGAKTDTKGKHCMSSLLPGTKKVGLINKVQLLSGSGGGEMRYWSKETKFKL